MVAAEAFDVVVIGAGAAGMMCAAEAGRRGRRTLLIDHQREAGEKIRISGGGRCNFTNLGTSPRAFLSVNPHFSISALSRYTAADFVALVDRHGIAWHEKTLGQLFCDGSAREIIAMLRQEMTAGGVALRLSTSVTSIDPVDGGFRIGLSQASVEARSLVIATGGLSVPKTGATAFGHDVARRFGLSMVPTRPGLVPLTFGPELLAKLAPLAGVSLAAEVHCGKARFAEAMLFTHRGLSGPAILQISSYWREGEDIVVSMLPGTDIFARLRQARSERGKQALSTVLADHLPRRLAALLAEETGGGQLADLSDRALRAVDAAVNRWTLRPSGSEGYRTAEVTVGGVDTAELDSRTLQAKKVPGLYFIGEVVDVTGWLGGYNFQWAWSSGWAAGQAV